MSALDLLKQMIRTRPGQMTVWSEPEVTAAVDAYRTEVLAGEKSSPARADAIPAPDFFQPGHTYSDSKAGAGTDWRFRCDTVTTHPENGERAAVGWRHFRGEWGPYAYYEDDYEVHQAVGITDVTEGGEES
ncbi:hypothetical protein ACFVHR_04560 [Streptomyces sp. NPDC127168]|uniref:hypothetical protein n=1 Tax=unclassified Streptomyces TaxID=2593676 RepID=UPI00362C616A